MKKRFRLSSILAIVLAINFLFLVGYTPAKTKIPVKSKTIKTTIKQKSKVTPKSKITTKKQTPSKTPVKPVKQVKPVKPAKPIEKVKPAQPKTDTKVQADNRPMGLFYKVKAGDATVYILGSMHITKPDMFPFNKTVEDAYASSKNLVVEVDITNTDALLKEQSKVYYPANDDIYNHLTAAGKEKFDALVKLYGMDAKVVKSIRTWAFGSAILSGISTTAGYGPGVDSYFLEKSKGNKTILELEGITYQYDMLNSFSDLDQENAFIGDLKSLEGAAAELNGMYDSYKAGDEKALIDLLLKPVPNVSADYNKKLLTDRNVGMADKIDGYLKTKDTYFVIAGAAHFIGDSSVIEFLTKKGYTVERIK